MKGSESCGTPCRFWRQLTDDGTARKSQGQCRRHAPRFDGMMYLRGVREVGDLAGGAMLWATSYPMTVADDWCGEFEPDGFQGPC